MGVSADGRIALTTDGKTLRVRDLEGAAHLPDAKQHRQFLDISANSQSDVAVTAEISTGGLLLMRRWDLPTQTCLSEDSFDEGWLLPSTIAASADGNTIIGTSGLRSPLRRWDLQSKSSTLLDAGGVTAFALSGDGAVGVSADERGTVRLWNTRKRVCVDRCDDAVKPRSAILDNEIDAIATDHRGDVVAALGALEIHVWRRERNALHHRVSKLDFHASLLSLSSDGRRVALANSWSFRVVDTETDECKCEWFESNVWLNSVCLSATGRLLATASDDAVLRVWDTTSCACVLVVQMRSGAARLRWSGRGYLAYLTDDGELGVAKVRNVEIDARSY